MDETLSVGFVDDDPVLLEVLPNLLEPHGLSPLWRAASGAEALALLAAGKRPDVVVLDIAMPGMSGHEVALRVTALYPGLPIVMLTSIDSGTSLREALACGALGFMVKHDPPERLVQLLRLAAAGQPVFSATPTLRLAEDFTARRPPADYVPLTERQLEVLRLASQGQSNEAIGRRLRCTPDNVKKHMAAIFERLDANDRASAVAIAIRAGLL